MQEALEFWNMSYENGWFARFAIVDKTISTAIGTIELCLRVSEDAFNNMGILRVDVRSDYEKEDMLYDIIALTMPHISELLGCNGVLTKAPIYAVERIKAIQKAGFVKSEHHNIFIWGCSCKFMNRSSQLRVRNIQFFTYLGNIEIWVTHMTFDILKNMIRDQ